MSSIPALQLDPLITGLPRWRLQEYLTDLGATLSADGWLHGEGWQARLTQMDDYAIGSLRVGRVRLELRGDAGALEAVREALAPKLLRAGG